MGILKDFVRSLNIDGGGKLLDIGSGDNFVRTINKYCGKFQDEVRNYG